MKILRRAFVGALLTLVFVGGCAGPFPERPAAQIERHSGIEEKAVSTLTPAFAPVPEVNWSDEVDFLELREHYGNRVDYGDRCEQQENRRAAFQALISDDFDRAIALTEPLLESCPVDASVHIWRAAALKSVSRNAEAETHRRWYMGLVDSILESGDGKSRETPFVTISTGEEHVVLSHLGLTPQRQSLVRGPNPMDAIVVEDESGNTSTVYFNPTLHFLRLFEMFP